MILYKLINNQSFQKIHTKQFCFLRTTGLNPGSLVPPYNRSCLHKLTREEGGEKEEKRKGDEGQNLGDGIGSKRRREIKKKLGYNREKRTGREVVQLVPFATTTMHPQLIE